MTRTLTAMGMLLLAMGITPAAAHHSNTFFESVKTIEVEGTVLKFEWTNPHVWLWVTVKDQNGVQQAWGLESANLSMAKRMGMTRSTFKVGEHLKLVINPMRDGRPGGRFRKAVFADGRVFSMAPGPTAPVNAGATPYQN
jgi:hypothetical protein